VPSLAERASLVRRAKLLAWGGNAWHVFEFAIAVGAGIAASSIALIAFGADSLIEALAGFVILWRFAASRAESEAAERRAQQLIAASYFVHVAYIVVESSRTFFGNTHPSTSWVGIALAAFTAVTMPLLAQSWSQARIEALVIAAIAGRKGIEAWRGDLCCDNC
jgi:divalent metal cation (Fe/Co/Zn/Cd) transporter